MRQRQKRAGLFAIKKAKKFKKLNLKKRSFELQEKKEAQNDAAVARSLIETLRVSYCPMKELIAAMEDYCPDHREPTYSAILTYARHYRTNYDAILADLKARGVHVFSRLAKLAANELIADTWPELKPASAHQARQVIELENERKYRWRYKITVDRDGRTNWQDLINQYHDLLLDWTAQQEAYQED